MIDLRSDTVTLPTDDMRRAMAAAELGDDVYGEDPTVNRLEEVASQRLGHEAGLFLPTGTMANQVAVMVHTRRGEEVLLDADSHIYYYESGGAALLSGCHCLPIVSEGVLHPDNVAEALRPENVHFPRPSLLCLENTHNRHGGAVMTAEQTDALTHLGRRSGLRVHLDGARLFNAAATLGVPAARLSGGVDSVMVSLSKGLSAPVGSVLAGDAEFIAAARRARKLLGGGMRQAGVLAAAGLLGLERMTDRLHEDHRQAHRLAEGLNQIKGLTVNIDGVQTNIVMCDLPADLAATQFATALKDGGVLINAVSTRRVRLVTHRHIDAPAVDRALSTIQQIIREW